MDTAFHRWILYNHPDLEVLPAVLVSARRSGDQRRLSHGRWLARRKRDGRYLAVMGDDGIVRPLPGLHRTAQLPDAEDWLQPPRMSGIETSRRLRQILSAIWGLNHRQEAVQHARHSEPRMLHHAGRDRFGRPLWLNSDTALHWHRMQAAAERDGVVLQAVSGYRSWSYQAEIIRRKLNRGLRIDDVLTVNALPGSSEHHSGRAIDIAEPGTPPAEISFETSSAFAWLRRFGGDFGFRLSYPRNNALGMAYEPWHWYWQGI